MCVNPPNRQTESFSKNKFNNEVTSKEGGIKSKPKCISTNQLYYTSFNIYEKQIILDNATTYPMFSTFVMKYVSKSKKGKPIDQRTRNKNVYVQPISNNEIHRQIREISK